LEGVLIITVNNTDGLTSAAKAAQAGDTILLAPGSYTTANLSGLTPSGMVTITSMDPSHPAVISGVIVDHSTNLTLTNLEVTPRYAGGYAVAVTNATNVHVANVNIHDSATVVGNGVLIQNSQHVTLDGSEIHDLSSGVSFLNSDGVLLANNKVHDTQVDGMHGGGTSHITITGNTFTNFRPQAGDHADAIQFWTTGTTTAAHDIVVTDNVMTRGAGAVFQGVFMGADPSLAFQNVTIAGNAMEGTMYNGIAVGNGVNVKIEHNLVQGYTDMTSWVTVNGTTNAVIDHNTTSSISIGAGNVGLSNYSNTIVPLQAIGSTSALTSWLKAEASTLASYSLSSMTGATGATTTIGGSAAATTNGATTTTASATAAMTSTSAATTSLITGTTGSDKLAGTAGADLIDGKGGADTMAGGVGNDTYIVDNAKDVVTEYANQGIDTVKTALASYTLPVNVENLVLTGNALQTGLGNDLNNVLTANSVGSSLNGGAGNDVLISVGGADTLTGGAASDTFRFEHTGAKPAVITDFTHGQDVIDLEKLLPGYTGSDPIADHWVKLVTDTTGTTVYVDSDGPSGSGGFVAVAKVLGVTSLSGSHDWLF
jgi:hypothetical protein